ncbi:NAC domain-containing protein 17 isoform X2 [Dendrobium catenatum]|uniref:NAC domain-containing protein 78 n=1 Tax=Dendrobium catenatum TaxID=906689 RepID=A0A2I0WFL0_9ASPA|nr:NAC domain-containing protein 17 isoform X2 [Dendrobium catenatum]PKU74422.1 NAC domain-containing protein 78 [Dendrobium catenatum]
MGAAADCSAPVGRRISSACDDDEEYQDVGRQLGESKRWPPGVRFHPTDEELVLFYLKRKICRQRIKPAMVGEADVYKCEPWELPEKSLLRKGDKQWFFFSPRDRKYPNGSRSNRATKHGYWKATGKDRGISHHSKTAGNKKTLVYYRGRAPKGVRTDWVMHEYTLDENFLVSFKNMQDSYALYKLFMKSGPGPKNGEQYGAPFREEEWDDVAVDESFMDQNDGDGMSAAILTSNSIPVTFSEGCDTSPVCDLEDLLFHLSQEQEIVQGDLDFSAYTSDLSKVDLEPENGSHVMNLSYVDADDSFLGIDTGGENSSMEMRFQNIQPELAHSQPIGLPNMISNQHIVTTDEEFLEIKDLNDPMTSFYLDDITDRNLTFDTDVFFDPFDQFDANMLLTESLGVPMDPFDQFNVNMLLTESLGVPLDPKTPHHHFDSFSEEDPQNNALHISSQLWAHEENYNLTTFANTNEVVALTPPAAGFPIASNLPSTSEIHFVEQIGPAESPSPSWFNSTLSGFLHSVPSSPAFASENALISRAFERVSSFRAAQVNPQQRASASGGHRSNDRGYLFISGLVGIVAVFSVLIVGTAFQVFKGLWGRFISS